MDHTTGDALQTVDDWQIRVPTFTPDIASTLHNIVVAKLNHAHPAEVLSGVFHYSAAERFTRWGLVLQFAALLGSAPGSPAPVDHIAHSATPLPGAPRPYDCALDCSKLAALGLAAPCTPFADAAQEVLRGLGIVQGVAAQAARTE